MTEQEYNDVHHHIDKRVREIRKQQEALADEERTLRLLKDYLQKGNRQQLLAPKT